MAVNTTLEFALLGLLADGPASGYELRRVFQTTPLGTYSDSPGSIYPALRRLELRRLISAARVSGARRRRLLHLTAAGRASLEEWATAPVSSSTRESDFELALRLSFLSSIAPRHIKTFLRQYAEVLEQRARDFSAAIARIEADFSPSNRLAVDLGLCEMQSRARWCRARLADLAKA